MKRGWALVTTLLLITLPSVLAQESVLDYFLGTTDDGLIFLRLLYGILVFIIFYYGAKGRLFSDDNALTEAKFHRLGVGLALVIALIVMRTTPDSVIQTFGWVITFATPPLAMWVLSGMFIQGRNGEFSWWRLLLAAILSLVFFYALGTSNAFTANIGQAPLVGPPLAELWSDVIYYATLPGWVIIPLAFLIGYILVQLFSRLAGSSGGGSGGGGGMDIGPALLLGLVLAGVVALIAWLLSQYGGAFGLPVFVSPFGTTLFTVLKWLGVILLLLLALYLLYLSGFVPTVWNWATGQPFGTRYFVRMTQPRRISWRVSNRVPYFGVGDAVGRRTITVRARNGGAPPVITQLGFRIYQGQFYWNAQPVAAGFQARWRIGPPAIGNVTAGNTTDAYGRVGAHYESPVYVPAITYPLFVPLHMEIRENPTQPWFPVRDYMIRILPPVGVTPPGGGGGPTAGGGPTGGPTPTGGAAGPATGGGGTGGPSPLPGPTGGGAGPAPTGATPSASSPAGTIFFVPDGGLPTGTSINLATTSPPHIQLRWNVSGPYPHTIEFVFTPTNNFSDPARVVDSYRITPASLIPMPFQRMALPNVSSTNCRYWIVARDASGAVVDWDRTNEFTVVGGGGPSPIAGAAAAASPAATGGTTGAATSPPPPGPTPPGPAGVGVAFTPKGGFPSP